MSTSLFSEEINSTCKWLLVYNLVNSIKRSLKATKAIIHWLAFQVRCTSIRVSPNNCDTLILTLKRRYDFFFVIPSLIDIYIYHYFVCHFNHLQAERNNIVTV